MIYLLRFLSSLNLELMFMGLSIEWPCYHLRIVLALIEMIVSNNVLQVFASNWFVVHVSIGVGDDFFGESEQLVHF